MVKLERNKKKAIPKTLQKRLKPNSLWMHKETLCIMQLLQPCFAFHDFKGWCHELYFEVSHDNGNIEGHIHYLNSKQLKNEFMYLDTLKLN